MNSCVRSLLFICILSIILSCSVTPDKTSIDHKSQNRHKICEKYVKWTQKMIATDKKGRMYQVYTCEDKIIFFSPFNSLIYSRMGNVIGFHTKGVFHFHPPSKGWKNVDISNVGIIKNQWESMVDTPDYSKYKAPPSSVPQN